VKTFPLIAVQTLPPQSTSFVVVVLLVVLALAAIAFVMVAHRRRERARTMHEASSQNLLATIGDPACIINAEGVVIDVNESARRAGRMAPGTSVYATMPAALAEARKAAVKQVFASDQPMRLEDVYEGEFSEVRLVPLHDASGAVSRVAVTSRDVTEQRQLEATLTRTIQFLQQILESSRTIAIISADRAGNVDYWNSGAEDLFGYRSEEAVGKRSITSLLADDDADGFHRLSAIIASVVSRQAPAADTFSMVHRNGGVRSVRLTFSPQNNAAGAIQGLLIIGEDITEQIAAKRDSEQAERKLRLLAFTLSCAKDAFILTNLENCILYVNQAFVETYGYSEDELLGKHISSLRESGEQFDILNDITGRLDRGDWAGQLVNRRKNGEMFPVELWTSFVRNDAGEPVAMVSVARDITDRKQSEARMHASLREKEVLLKEVHHRVKNNLQVITSLLNLQADRIADKRLQGVLKENQTRIKSMALVHEELYQSEDLSWINFSEYLRRLTSGLMQTYGKTGKTVTVRFEVEDDVRLGIDAAIPCGLLVNELLTNALDHAFAGRDRGNVIVRFSRAGKRCVLGVADDGVGLPVSIDVHATETLGLHLVSTLTDQLRGALSVKRGGGTSFVLEFEEHSRGILSPGEG